MSNTGIERMCGTSLSSLTVVWGAKGWQIDGYDVRITMEICQKVCHWVGRKVGDIEGCPDRTYSYFPKDLCLLGGVTEY